MRPPTWSPSWLTSSASATICTSIRATSIRRRSWTLLEEGYRDGILEQRPTLVNLQCDVDHPTQCMADMLHVIHYFGGVENLKGKKVAMTWAYSPSYGKPLSVPQGVIGLFTRFGMDVTLAHPEGYDVIPRGRGDRPQEQCEKPPAPSFRQDQPAWKKPSRTPTSFIRSPGRRSRRWKSATEAVCRGRPRRASTSWRSSCWRRTPSTRTGLATEEMMKLTKDGKALYLHCLPADITGLSCKEGEVDNSVFDRYLVPLYKAGQLQALHHRRDDLPGQGQGPGQRPDGAGRRRRQDAKNF